MEPKIIEVENCLRFWIVEQRWGFDRGASQCDSIGNRVNEPDAIETAYIFNPMNGPYARAYQEWVRVDNRRHPQADRPRFAYIVEARTRRQVVEAMNRQGHIAMFNNRLQYPMMISHYTGVTQMDLRDREIARLSRVAEKAEEKIEFLLSLPDEPKYDDERPNVIFFEKRFGPGSRIYTYAAVRADNGLWYTTGPSSPKGYAWDQLITWINEAEPTTVYAAKKFKEI